MGYMMCLTCLGSLSPAAASMFVNLRCPHYQSVLLFPSAVLINKPLKTIKRKEEEETILKVVSFYGSKLPSLTSCIIFLAVFPIMS
jgi:hypothetical protein